METSGFHSRISRLAIDDVGDAIDLRISVRSIEVCVNDSSDEEDSDFELRLQIHFSHINYCFRISTYPRLSSNS